ncbi:hypothetical protein HL033_00790 [Neoehrlichia mikurensis]|uniref:Integral membrane protein n=1 Tax=Neoehrlichia mikurensis TaxID=89586 RepID=A0ABY5EXN4_9RICK|nr:hypothetical protein [Neoehrlichia mikurensis]QXK92105.1 hypothetical protein IAH97_00785 [Neoehrlichia mikurensis]QXK92563.1 hypothetical protein HUN61_00790 [Neoehrlichia mikurensis]QXK93799.1 hypothetical protein HL033_00790 [Neoehrlichia mikurensis]UTO56146.1 hypothetical protein LUA81_03430 [Neoehrlichia mikurensis]
MIRKLNPLERKVCNIVCDVIEKKLNHGFITNFFEKLFTKKPKDSHSIAVFITESVLSIAINNTHGYIPTETFFNVMRYLDGVFIEQLKSNSHHDLLSLFYALDRYISLHPTEFKLDDLNQYIAFVNKNVHLVQKNALVISAVALLNGDNLCILTKKWFLIRALSNAIANIYVQHNNKTQEELSIEFETHNNLMTYFYQRDNILNMQLRAEESFQDEHPIIDKLLNTATKILSKLSYMPQMYITCIFAIFVTRTVDIMKFKDFVDKNNKSNSCNLPLSNSSYYSTSCEDFDFDEYFPQYGGIINALSTLVTTLTSVICLFASVPQMLFSKYRSDCILYYSMRRGLYNKSPIRPYSASLAIRWLSNMIIQFIDIFNNIYVKSLMQWYIIRSFVPLGVIENTQVMSEFYRVVSQSSAKLDSNGRFVLNRKYIFGTFVMAVALEYTTQALKYNGYLVTYNALGVPVKLIRVLSIIVPYVTNRVFYGISYHPELSKFLAFSSVRCISSPLVLPLFDNIQEIRYMSLITALDIILTVYADTQCSIIADAMFRNRIVISCIKDMKSYAELQDFTVLHSSRNMVDTPSVIRTTESPVHENVPGIISSPIIEPLEEQVSNHVSI